MPILANAKKALRSSKRKQAVNRQTKSKLKTALDSHKKQPNKESLSSAYSMIDRAVKNKVIHFNKGKRLKKQMSRASKP